MDHLLYGLAWASFGGVHSWLAGDGPKAALKSSLGPRYRLAYNFIAILQIVAVTRFGKYLLPMEPFDGTSALIGVSILGGGLMLLALRTYDLGLLAGTKQIQLARQGLPPEEEQPLTLSGLHLLVRHPVYSAGFLILWGLAGTEYGLATAIWGSVYLIIGAGFEERRLAARFGDAYLSYKSQVPAFIPWKGRVHLQ